MELLTVMTILAILASITLVVGRSVSERSKVAQARAEMAVLAAALEQYKQQYGDYPWTPDGVTSTQGPLDGGAILFNALCGNMGPKATELPVKGRTFVDLTRFAVDLFDDEHLPEVPDPASGISGTELKRNWFNDPWGNWYYYHYRKDAPGTTLGDEWKSRGFLLYSHGPDGECQVGDAGDTGLIEDLPKENVAPQDFANNRDNIYHGHD